MIERSLKIVAVEIRYEQQKIRVYKQLWINYSKGEGKKKKNNSINKKQNITKKPFKKSE